MRTAVPVLISAEKKHEDESIVKNHSLKKY